MVTVIQGLMDWLGGIGLDLSGVRIVLVFPDAMSRDRAVQRLQDDVGAVTGAEPPALVMLPAAWDHNSGHWKARVLGVELAMTSKPCRSPGGFAPAQHDGRLNPRAPF